jgi:hypothetical protein
MSMCMYGRERVQAMSLHDECWDMFVYSWGHGVNALWGLMA